MQDHVTYQVPQRLNQEVRHGRFQNRGTRFGYLVVTPVDGVADQLDRGEPLLSLDDAKARLATRDGALGPRIVVVTQSIAWGEVEL